MPDDARILYAITAADCPSLNAAARGLGGKPLTLQRQGAITAIVSTHDRLAVGNMFENTSPDTLETYAEAYYTCLNQLCLVHDILPMRFGTVLPDAVAVSRYLDTHADALLGAAHRTRGAVEWAIRLRRLTKPLQHDCGATPTGYLRQRQDERRRKASAAEAVEALSQRIVQRLASDPVLELVVDPVSDRPDGCFLSLRALVRRGEDKRFLAHINALLGDLPDTDADLFGPEAPFTFAALEPMSDAA